MKRLVDLVADAMRDFSGFCDAYAPIIAIAILIIFMLTLGWVMP